MYLSTSTSTEDFPEMYLSTFQVLYKLYLSTDVLKYKVLLPGSDIHDLCYFNLCLSLKLNIVTVLVRQHVRGIRDYCNCHN